MTVILLVRDGDDTVKHRVIGGVLSIKERGEALWLYGLKGGKAMLARVKAAEIIQMEVRP